MATAARPKRIYRFGQFQVDLCAGTLLRKGAPVKFQDQPLKVLCLLLERPGEIVSREDLRRSLWPDGTYVEFDGSLNAALNRLRSTLGDDADNPRFIETVPKRGYRFIAPVEPACEFEAGATPLQRDPNGAASPDAALPATDPWWRRKSLIAAVTAAVIVTAGALLTARRFLSAGVPAVHSLAVMPFTGSSGNPDAEFLQDGISIGVTDALSRLPGLKVMSTTAVMRYAQKNADPRKVGHDLRVDAVLSGEIEQTGGSVIVNAELVKSAEDTHIWGKQYIENMVNIAVLQQEIARDISDKLHMKLTAVQSQEMAEAKIEDPEAYRLYLLGHHEVDQFSPAHLMKAAEYFQQAIAKDPTYAAAHAGLADADSNLGYLIPSLREKSYAAARTEAAEALALDPRSAEAHVALATLDWMTWKFADAGPEFRRAEQLNPNFVNAPEAYSTHLVRMGQFPEAMDQVQRALELDPLSTFANMQLGIVFEGERDYRKAIAQYEKTLAMDPDNAVVYRRLGGCYGEIGNYDKFVESEARYFQILGQSEEAAELGRFYAQFGVKGVYRWYVRQESDPAKPTYSPTGVAANYALLGDKEDAFRWLETAYRQRASELAFVESDPAFDSLHRDPRYSDLLRRIGLPH